MAMQSWRLLQQKEAWEPPGAVLYVSENDVKKTDLNDCDNADDDSIDNSSCYLCPNCGKACSSERELNNHISADHVDEINNESDDVTNISNDHFSESSWDNISAAAPVNNTNGYTYACKLCPKTFSSSSTLNVHYTHTHKDKPQYDCEICGETFGVKREYATHKRSHDGHPAHSCRQCGKEFGTRQLLRKHELWHTGERNHVCSQCGKAFFQKGHLTQHLMIHAGGRPHACHLCPKTFIFKFDLNRHMKIHAERENGAADAFSNANNLSFSPRQHVKEELSVDGNLNQRITDFASHLFLCKVEKNQAVSAAAKDFAISDISNNSNNEIVPCKTIDNGDDSHETTANHEESTVDGNNKGDGSPSNSSGYSASSVVMLSHNAGAYGNICCEKCVGYRNQLESSRRYVAELETSLVQRHQEIEALKWKMQRVSSVAGHLLETCSDFDKLWMLHSKKVYNEMQNVLSMLQ